MNNNPVIDEWYVSNFIDKNIKVLESQDAFDISKQFIKYMIDQYDVNSEYEIVETFRYLRLQANTNEKFYTNDQRDKIFELYQQEYSKTVLAEIL